MVTVRERREVETSVYTALRDELPGARLKDGCRVIDASDMKQWLNEKIDTVLDKLLLEP